MRLAMPTHTFHVLQAVEERDGGIVPVEPKACPSCRLRPCVGCPACANPRRRHRLGTNGRSRTRRLGSAGIGVIPASCLMEAGGGVE